jgi:hypothetical protein
LPVTRISAGRPAALLDGQRYPVRFVRVGSVAGVVGEVGGKAAPPVQVPAERGVMDAERVSQDLLAGLVEARNAAGHGRGRRDWCFGAHGEVGAGAKEPAPGHVRELNAGTPTYADPASASHTTHPGACASRWSGWAWKVDRTSRSQALTWLFG